MVSGYTVDLSESGVSAILRLEIPLGEVATLDLALPFGPVTIHATVRQRNAFRYGFEFVDSDSVLQIIRRMCRDLAVEQFLFGGFETPISPTTGLLGGVRLRASKK